jgi:hypothetical protein
MRAIRETRVSKAFFRGNYREALELGLAPGARKPSDTDLPFLIGALGFQGRRDEAQALFARREKSLSESARIASRFFLGISFCRHGEYAKARAYLATNITEGKRSKDRVSHFYLLQGLGFYRYICARFESARKSAEGALAQATWAGFGYGIALAGDLLGHNLVQLGRIREGLGQLEEAERAAGRIGDGGLARSIRMSGLVYRAQFGLKPSRDLRDLESALVKLDPQNSYAQSNLLLEIANQLLLRGRLAEASQSLSEASTRIYRSRHLRHGNLLSLRLAELSFRAGQSASALHSVKSVRALLDERHDRVLLLMALGLELKLLRELGLSEAEDEVRRRLERLTRATPRLISRAILARANPAADRAGATIATAPSEDPLGTLVCAVRREPEAQLRKLISAGYLQLLHEALGVPRSGCSVVFGILGHDCAILERGEVLYRAKGVTQQMIALLTALGSGERSKAELVQMIWGYKYHPLRHDPLMFQAVSRARELLGSRSHWIESTATGYRLRQEVRVRSFLREEPRPEPAHVPRQDARSSELNFRQIRILELMKTKRFVGAGECAKKFRVTEMTARRDFTALRKAGWIARTGRARATRYELCRNFD